MFDRNDLRAAVGANVLSADQAARLEAFLIARHDTREGRATVTATGTGQENLRFLANFNDIFITMGIGILFVGIIAMIAMAAAPAVSSGNLMTGVAAAALVSCLAWLLLEYFCGRRRLLLPSMSLAAIFSGFVSLTVTAFAATQLDIAFNSNFNPSSMFKLTGTLSVIAALASLGAGALVFLRFRLPFALAIIAGSAAGAVYSFLGFFGQTGLLLSGAAFLLMGLATLAAAIWFDMQDPERIRKPSDNAFWLHLAAAPQVIWGVSTLVTGSNLLMGTISGTDNATQSLTLLIMLLLIGVVSLALNRRALIAASLLTFIFALSFVLSRAGLDASNIFIMVTIIIGGGVVLLGAGWKTARRAVLVFFPKGGTWDKVFPPEPA